MLDRKQYQQFSRQSTLCRDMGLIIKTIHVNLDVNSRQFSLKQKYARLAPYKNIQNKRVLFCLSCAIFDAGINTSYPSKLDSPS